MNNSDLEAPLKKIEAIHSKLGEEIAAMRLMLEQYRLGVSTRTIEIATAYNPGNPSPLPEQTDELAEAKKSLIEGYDLDRPEDEERLLKTLVLRQLEASVRGFKSALISQARLVAKAFIEQAGMRASGKGYGDAKLSALFKKHIQFDPITSLRRVSS